MYYPYYYDPTYIILIPAIILTMYAQFKVSSTTNRYFRVRTQRGYTGEQTAREILNANGRNKILRLSQDVYRGTSITSVAVAAHECGHAIQHARGYAPLTIRGAIVPVVNFASNASWILIMLGLCMTSTTSLLKIGILLFATTVVFQLITLPVEFNASHRALIQIENLGIVTRDERRESKKVLDAAALTYVAAAASAILQLLRLITIANRRDD